MNMRKVDKMINSFEVSEGAGVTVHRSIGTPALKNYDPFLMLDRFVSDDPDDYIAGFPDHPHRGFITLTYMIEGHMEHKDSMGNQGQLRSGGAQWMKAASGVIHSEMPKQQDGLMSGFQLWINLPAKEKMTAPAYQEYSPDSIPIANQQGVNVRVISGQVKEANGKLITGPIVDDISQLLYLDVNMTAGSEFIQDLPQGLKAFIYLISGKVKIKETEVGPDQFIGLADGEYIEVKTDEEARFILVAGKPINEPIVQYGPFVMNTQDEIKQAFQDYQNGTLVKERAEFISD